jgi:hypothetical protein
LFREAWIAGVNKHYPGEPKNSYIAPWEKTPDWERSCAAAVEQQIQQFVTVTDGAATQLTREQQGRFVALCWIGQIYKNIAEPKPAYVADWDALPDWQQQTDCDIFEAVASA